MGLGSPQIGDPDARSEQEEANLTLGKAAMHNLERGTEHNLE